MDPVDFADAIRNPYDPLDTDEPSPASVEFVTRGWARIETKCVG